MKKTILLSIIYITSGIISFGIMAASEPIKTPAYFGGYDTLSKFSRFKSPFEGGLRGMKESGVSSKLWEERKGIDELQDLIADPRVVYSSYFGGNGYDCSYGITVDSKDNIYLVGYSGSTNLPTTAGCFQKDKSGGHDAFIAKFTPDGQPIWITFYGGSGTDVATACVVDKNDNLIVVGKTDSKDFPISGGTEQDTSGGGIDVFLLKFSPDGQRIWARYYGGEGGDIAEGIALLSNDDFVIAGGTSSYKLPIIKGTYQDTLVGGIDIFISRFMNDGRLVWGAYFGGLQWEMAHSVATDKNDNIGIAGETKTVNPNQGVKFPVSQNAFQKDTSGKEDAFISVLYPNGQLNWSTLYGGKATDRAYGITFDNEGSIFFCGYTQSDNFPTSPDAFKPIYSKDEAFVVKFSSDFIRKWATFYGGYSGNLTPQGNEARAIASDDNGNIWITGETTCSDFPIIGDSIHGITKPAIGGPKIILLKMDENGKPIYSAYYGSGLSFGYSIFSKNTNIYFTGECQAAKFPTTENAFQKRFLGGEYDSYLSVINLDKSSIYDFSNNSLINVFPNPFLDNLFIVNNSIDYKIESIKLQDLFGSLIFKYDNINFQKKIILDLSNLFPGFYILSYNLDYSYHFLKIIKL